jgi:hypothetical protein
MIHRAAQVALAALLGTFALLPVGAALAQQPEGVPDEPSNPPEASASSAPPPAASSPPPPGSPAAAAPAPAIQGSAALSAVTPSTPQDTTPDAAPPPRTRPLPHHIGIQLGVRTTHIPHSGYDPYADSNGLAQAAFAATYTPWRSLPLSVHLVGEWDIGRTSSIARGDPTSLMIHRIALGIEGRYEPVSRLYLFAKVAPSALHLRGEIEDIPLGATLASRTWTWGLDTTGGAALRLGNAGKEADPGATFWLMLDMGYSFTGEAEMIYRPAELDENEGRRFGDIALPSIRPGGFVTRIAGAMTF